MKKTLKVLGILLITGMMLVLLTGCGSDKLVAKKTTEDNMMGKYKEKIVMTFKDDKVETINASMEFDDEEKAQAMYELYNVGLSMTGESEKEGKKVKQNGKKLVITMDAKAYAEAEGASDEEMTKDVLKKALEENGYTVK